MKNKISSTPLPNNSTEGKIVASLERISQAFRVLLWQESMAFSLSPIQVQLIVFLHLHQPELCKVSYLAEEFNLTKATISDAVKSLEQKELIKKVYVKSDFRSYTIHLTKKGKNIALHSAEFNREILKPIQSLPGADKNLLLNSLLNIIRHLNAAGVISLKRMCFSCQHFRPDQNGTTGFCGLLNQKLKQEDLQIDCPEHLAMADASL